MYLRFSRSNKQSEVKLPIQSSFCSIQLFKKCSCMKNIPERDAFFYSCKIPLYTKRYPSRLPTVFMVKHFVFYSTKIPLDRHYHSSCLSYTADYFRVVSEDNSAKYPLKASMHYSFPLITYTSFATFLLLFFLAEIANCYTNNDANN